MLERTPLRDRAKGRWPGILSALGVDAKTLSGRNVPCPICQAGKDRFRFTDHDQAGLWVCNQCGGGDGADLVMKWKAVDFKEAARLIEGVIGEVEPGPAAKRNPAADRREMAKLWKAGHAIEVGDAVDLWMKGRGIILSRYPDQLRTGSHNGCAVMLARVLGPDGKPVNVHRTYLRDDGSKAFEKTRFLMKGETPIGSAVRLMRHTTTLGIAEGIETALAAWMLFKVPVWASLTAGHMEAWRPPDGVTDVHVFGDSDANYQGHKAAYALAHRLSIKKLAVTVHIPPGKGVDWNDELNEKARAA
ncbi:MAG: toprim domain-containing protein [Pseudomonadota bacterium]